MTATAFDGKTFEAKRDGARLARQLTSVKQFMRPGHWRTLDEIATAVDAPTASVSARLRDLRKAKFGGFTVERRYVANGVWAYRVTHPRFP